MVKFIIRLVVNAVAIWIASLILSNVKLNGTILEVLIVALIFGLVNALMKPILKLLGMPFIVVTLGLFTLVINAFLLWIVDLLSGDILEIEGILTYLWASIIISAVSWALNLVLPEE